MAWTADRRGGLAAPGRSHPCGTDYSGRLQNIVEQERDFGRKARRRVHAHHRGKKRPVDVRHSINQKEFFWNGGHPAEYSKASRWTLKGGGHPRRYDLLAWPWGAGRSSLCGWLPIPRMLGAPALVPPIGFACRRRGAHSCRWRRLRLTADH